MVFDEFVSGLRGRYSLIGYPCMGSCLVESLTTAKAEPWETSIPPIRVPKERHRDPFRNNTLSTCRPKGLDSSPFLVSFKGSGTGFTDLGPRAMGEKAKGAGSGASEEGARASAEASEPARFGLPKVGVHTLPAWAFRLRLLSRGPCYVSPATCPVHCSGSLPSQPLTSAP